MERFIPNLAAKQIHKLDQALKDPIFFSFLLSLAIARVLNFVERAMKEKCVDYTKLASNKK